MHFIVIGAGLAGITVAWELRQSGHGVTVLDRGPEPASETSYANAFRTNASADEVFLDFGINHTVPVQQSQDGNNPAAEILFKIDERLILNYYTAKRLAITLSNIVRRHEERFGELQVNVADRAKKG